MTSLLPVERIVWRIARGLRKLVIRLSKNPRPPSYPYISGDGFRAMANHVHDNLRSFNPASVRTGEIVFVCSDMIDTFFTDIHKNISAPYILITHNGDRNITEKETLLIDEKIIHWFAQNVLVRHEKITPIPIGLENAHYANAGVTRFYARELRESAERNERILVAFNPYSSPRERIPVLDSLKENPRADIVERIPVQKKYVQLLGEYTYVASPPGNGEDCHRTWEALYAGTFPLVRRSVCMEYFKSLGLPIILIDDWSQTDPVKPGDMSEDALWFPYWKELIETHRKQ